MDHNGSLHRTRTQEKAYSSYRKGLKSGCQFCKFSLLDREVIEEQANFWIVTNRFPYALWDDRRVAEHLMIVPKRHVLSLSEFNDREKRDYMDLIADFEKRGYSIYSRTDASPTKSVAHQHTHLIRIDDKPISALYFRSNPHILIYR